MARVEQISDKTQVPAAYHDLYDRIVAARGRIAGPYSILLHVPAVADQVDRLSATLHESSELSPQEFVLAALSVARAKDSLFVWSVQAPNARRAGVSEAAIAAIRDRTTDGLTEAELDLVNYAQHVVTANSVDAGLFKRLQERHGTPWLVGLTTTAGHFALISAINNAFEVPPSPAGDTLPI